MNAWNGIPNPKDKDHEKKLIPKNVCENIGPSVGRVASDRERCFVWKDASLFAHGGEGSPRWFLIKEHQHLPGGFDFYAGLGEAVKKGQAEMLTCKEFGNAMPGTYSSDDSKWHLDNWIDCMRARNKQTNGHILTGYWHSIGVVMATRAYREGKKLYYDRELDDIVESELHPAADSDKKTG